MSKYGCAYVFDTEFSDKTFSKRYTDDIFVLITLFRVEFFIRSLPSAANIVLLLKDCYCHPLQVLNPHRCEGLPPKPTPLRNSTSNVAGLLVHVTTRCINKQQLTKIPVNIQISLFHPYITSPKY